MNQKLKRIIFDKLYKDLSNVEIIPYDDSVWFIDREKKYWYLEYEKSGILFWRWKFFTNFFKLFSLRETDFEPIISEWVEEALNCEVTTTQGINFTVQMLVEEALNCKVTTTRYLEYQGRIRVEEVLNCKVTTNPRKYFHPPLKVEEVLNCKVTTTRRSMLLVEGLVEEVLNSK